MKKYILLAACLLAVSVLQAATCTQTGFFRDGINMTAAVVNPTTPVTGEIDATGCNIGVYFDQGTGSVSNANIHGSNYFGVLVNGDVGNVAVNILNSTITEIGEDPMNGTQHGVAVYYRGFASGTASGKVSGNTITYYQKGGIVANGAGTTVNIAGNTVTGQGPIDWIAQNGIQVGYGATAQVMRNIVSGNQYSGTWGASSGGIIVVGGSGYGDYPLTTGTQIVGNTLVDNDIGAYISNWDASGPPTVQTNIKVMNNVISNSDVTNISGNGTTGYQACVSDVGNNDKIINNTISGLGCTPPGTSAIAVYGIDADPSYAIKAKVHATK